jgi:lipopolysaccharide transport system ATP-binding protein
MAATVIRVEHLSKQYRLGTVGTGTLSHDLNRWWHRMCGRPDPYLAVTASNDRTRAGTSDYVWALRDVGFEVERGEVLGIIGRNGAGKSTLLKILARVTAPTQGEVRIKGRVGSLLEIGTGFHPELTGRENVYLNGAILGMTRAEVTARFDEIVDFSGCERYIDTPVKRYSSGMMVRLAFAVAAHLDPEILIVDEVLAVGDLAFQQKCLGKMDAVAHAGRTVLFVSHNMTAVSRLCSRVMVLDDGRVVCTGDAADGVSHYRVRVGGEAGNGGVFIDAQAFETESDCRLTALEILNGDGARMTHVGTGDRVCMRIHYALDRALRHPSFGLRFLSRDRETLMRLVSDACGCPIDVLPEGAGYVDCIIPRWPFIKGSVAVDLDLGIRGSHLFHHVTDAVQINVAEGDFYGSGVPFDSARRHGFFACEHSWRVHEA